jgi:hypothetical protein
MGFIFGLGFEHAGFRIIRAPGPEVFVPFAHVAIRKAGRFAQQLVHDFVQFIHVFGECFPIGQMARAQGVVFEVGFQVDATVFAGENVLQPFYKCSIVAFVCGAGTHGVIETHGVQKVPHGRTPHGGQEAIVGQKIVV